jgi:hypothetical protein
MLRLKVEDSADSPRPSRSLALRGGPSKGSGVGTVTTRYFDDPVVVCYRGDPDCCRKVLALGVRRTEGDTYDVLIIEGHTQGVENTSWVPRSRIRVPDAAMTCCAE